MRETSRPRPVFCVVTPSFNQAEFLEQTIVSVLSQRGCGSEFDLRYAVIDGGSRDGSVDIIRKYEDRLTFWCSEKDRGQSHAINKGFARLEGDLYAYINSDDYYLPDAFLSVLAAANKHPGAALLHGVCQRVDASGQHLGDQQSDIKRFAQLIDLWNHWLHPHPNRNFVQPEVFWTRRFHQQVGRFNESLHYTMDFDFWLRGLELGLEVASIDAPLAAFRVHANQKTTARDASILELVDRIAPFLTTEDRRISPEQRQRLLLHSRLTRRVIEAAEWPPERRVTMLLAMAAEDPALLRSPLYWRYLRRNGKRVFWKRSAA
jgi:glycosyltransferase involved in cell wall biosynthesis